MSHHAAVVEAEMCRTLCANQEHTCKACVPSEACVSFHACTYEQS